MSFVSLRVLRITTVYMGPATKIFLDRQTKFHMDNLDFNDLKVEHLPKLLYWINVSGKLVIGNRIE